MRKVASGLVAVFVTFVSVAPGIQAQEEGPAASAAAPSSCAGLPSYSALRRALSQARDEANGGLDLDMWGTVVNRWGTVCAVAYTGNTLEDQWLGSRVISAQKANTANAFSLPRLSLSTANLYTATQPGGSLFGLQESNPVRPDLAYAGPARTWGTSSDPMVGERIGGVNVFGGGLALYNARGVRVGAIGVSGDTSCADHNIAYRTRHYLQLDYVPGGVSGDATRKDNVVFDITPQGGGDTAPGAGQMPGVSKGGFGHASCHGYSETGNLESASFASQLPANRVVK